MSVEVVKIEQVNNKEVDDKQQIAVEEKIEAENNGKTQQVEATPAAVDAAAAPKPPAKPTVHKTDFEKDVVYLYQFSRTKNIPSPSPFCLKVETWLRMAGIKYEVRPP